MIALIDTIFAPVINWLIKIKTMIFEMSVPLSRPVELGQYLGPFAHLGPYWILFITTGATLGFVYLVAFMVTASQGVFIKFKDTIKWW